MKVVRFANKNCFQNFICINIFIIARRLKIGIEIKEEELEDAEKEEESKRQICLMLLLMKYIAIYARQIKYLLKLLFLGFY